MASPANPKASDIEVSRQCYHQHSDRHPVRICVDGRGQFKDVLELFVEDVLPTSSGALFLIGEICDVEEGRFFRVQVLYSAHDEPSECTGHMLVYLPKEGDAVVPEYSRGFSVPI